ncbi:MAG: hypothetical protein WCC74_01880 [Minisyncoccia bacterium]
MSWATRRKTTYLGAIILFFVIFVGIILYFIFSTTPTCFDKVQNQNETGIDCGGVCEQLCRAEYVAPNLLWTRWSKIKATGLYSIIAYLENPNIGVGSDGVNYDFRVYDRAGVLLGERLGRTSIPSNKDFAVFEDQFNLYDKIPARVDFVFTENIPWKKLQSKEESITVISKSPSNMDIKPKVDFVVKNASLSAIYDIEFVGILYDIDGNAIAFSKTKIDKIEGQSEKNAVFTWPEPFNKDIYKIEIISKVLSPLK